MATGYTKAIDRMQAEEPINPLTGMSRRVIERNHLVTMTLVICLMGGFVVPLPGWGLDILLVINVCLTAALVMIGFTGKSSPELGSLPGLLTAATLLRILGHAAMGRSVFSGADPGRILTLTGQATGFLQSAWIRLLGPAAALVVLVAVVQTVRKIHQVYVGFVEDTVVAEELRINSEFRKGLLDRATAERRRGRLEIETMFYQGLAGATDLVRIEGIIVAAILLGLSFGFQRTAPREGAQPYWFSSLTAAAFAMILPEFLITMGCRRLGGVLTAGWPKPVVSPSQQAETITIVSEQTGQPEEVELLNPDFRDQHNPIVSAPVEQVVAFEPPNSTEPASAAAPAQPPAPSEDFYLGLCRRIWSGGKAIVLAARSLQELPVTVVVNLAIRLAESEDKVLLVDVEKGRNALGEVFDLQESSAPKSVPSCIENVHVWMGRDFEEWTDEECSAAMEGFQRVLIYAPQIGDWPAQMALARKADRILLFGRTDSTPDRPPTVWGRTAEPVPPAKDSG